MLTLGDLAEGLGAGAEPFGPVGQVHLRPDEPDAKAAREIAFAKAGVDQRCLEARIRADQQAGVRLLDAGDGGVEDVSGPPAGLDPGAVLAAVGIGRAERRHQVL